MQRTLTVIALLLVTAASAVAEEPLVPGQTVADRKLQRDVLRVIATMQAVYAPDCPVRIVETRSPGYDGTQPEIHETWILERCPWNSGDRILDCHWSMNVSPRHPAAFL